MRTLELCDGYGTESVRRVRVFPNQEPSWLATPAGCLTEGSGSASRSPRPRSGHTGDSLTRRRSVSRRRSRPGRRSRALVHVCDVLVRTDDDHAASLADHAAQVEDGGARHLLDRKWRAVWLRIESMVTRSRCSSVALSCPGARKTRRATCSRVAGPADERSELRR